MSTVFVFCGGRGKRMGQATEEIPKPLIPVSGKPMIDHIVSGFRSQGFSRFVFGTGYLSESIESHLHKEHQDLDYIVSNSGTEAGMFRRLWEAKQFLDDTVVVAYGDTFVDIDYPEIIRQHKASNCDISMVTGQIQSPFGVVESNNQVVTSFVEKPTYEYYIGSFVFTLGALTEQLHELADLPDGQGIVEFFKGKIKTNKVRRHLHTGIQVTFNTENERLNAERIIGQYHTIKEN